MPQTIALTQADLADPFAQRLADDSQSLNRSQITTLQLNVGKMCNLACHHCHVESSPTRTEIMTWSTMQRILDWIDAHRQAMDLKVVDLTGGAPEMNPHFRELVTALKERGLHVLDRCNLTILLAPGYETLGEFLAGHEVEIVASLPCYLQDNVDKQRGQGVFDESIKALLRLNELGYGQPDQPRLRLDLVYNPVGYGLPPAQDALERDYKKHLSDHFGIVFNRLWTITNMPIRRFEHALKRDGQFDAYMDKLMTAHNPANLESVMCRHLVSVGWQGTVYDCDFNQMLLMPVEAAGDAGTQGEWNGDADGASAVGSGASGQPGAARFADEHAVEAAGRKLWSFDADELIGRRIQTGGHCFGCTAGAGSSCTGSLS